MIDYINTHLSGFWIAAGFVMLATEVLLFGFSTIIFLFAGIGAIATGLLVMAGILPETWVASTASFGIGTGLISVLLWKPLRKLQDDNAPVQAQSSDLVGYEFVLQQDISLTQPGTHRYSGIEWRVEVDVSSAQNTISSGERVSVVTLDAGVFRVRPV